MAELYHLGNKSNQISAEIITPNKICERNKTMTLNNEYETKLVKCNTNTVKIKQYLNSYFKTNFIHFQIRKISFKMVK